MARRNNGEGSVYRRADGKWVASCTVGFRDGKQVRRTRVCSSALQAREALRQLKLEFAGGLDAVRNGTVAEWLVEWLADVVAPESAANTHYSYQLAVKNHIAPYLGEVILDKLAAANIVEWLAHLKRKGTGERTRQNAYVVLRKAMADAFRLGKRIGNPCEGVQKPKHKAETIDPFEAVEVQRMLKATKGTRWYLLVVLAVSCGARRGEILGLQWSSVKLGKHPHIVIDQQQVQVGGRSMVGKPKSEAGNRKIPLTPEAVAAVKEHRDIVRKLGLSLDSYVFMNREGFPVSVSALAKNVWAPLLRKLGIRHRGIHHCRHTFATFALHAGVSIVELSKLLGHSKPSVTLNTYAHVIAALQDHVTSKLGTMYQ
jgi:integrase